jgi:hypothetical protein
MRRVCKLYCNGSEKAQEFGFMQGVASGGVHKAPWRNFRRQRVGITFIFITKSATVKPSEV